jgi:dTDP-4-dehydrorhamnose reductase
MTGIVLVTGAAGQLGSAIVRAFSHRPVVAHTRVSLELTDPAAVGRILASVAPAVIINCAAFNYVDAAEDRPTEALAVNAFAVRSLARAAESLGATLVHFGTDFVFDGSACEPYAEDAVPAPQSAYALSKLLGDWFALDVERSYVLRVESLFGSPPGWTGRKGTLDGIVEGLRQGREVPVFTDRIVSPSYVPDVVAAVTHLLECGAPPGLYHCVNSGSASWHDVATEAARLLGVTPRLRPLTTEQIPLKAARPKFCALDNGKLAAAGYRMPPWQDALRRWLATSA